MVGLPQALFGLQRVDHGIGNILDICRLQLLVTPVYQGYDGELLGQACQVVHQIVLNSDQLPRLEDSGLWIDVPHDLFPLELQQHSMNPELLVALRKSEISVEAALGCAMRCNAAALLHQMDQECHSACLNHAFES